jgi:NADPH:quinone reductase
MRGYITDPAAPGGLRLATDLPEPRPAAGEVLVEVHAYSVNRGELRLLARRPDGWRPGQDLAGVVTRAAEAGGPPEGARVVGIVDWECWAERVAVPVDQVAVLPDSVSFEQAAALPIAGLTALRALRLGGPLLGRQVLVTGATGGVGQFATQLAVAAGARVTAQVSIPEREKETARLGAHQTVTSLEDATLGPFDLVLDGVGGQVLTAAVHRLTPGGTAVTYGTVGGPATLSLADFRAAPLARVVGFFYSAAPAPMGADLAVLAGLVADGRLDPLLGLVRGWEHTVEVLDALRNRQVRGKAVLTRG